MRTLWRVFAVLLALSFAACASPSGRGTSKAGIGSGQEGEGISRAELQDSLLRFEMNFNESLRDAFRPIDESAPAALRTQALRSWLLYASSSLDISLGPVPESNLLDMMVFIELSRRVFERHWLPKVYGEKGKPVLEAFRRSRSELADIALKVLTMDQVRHFLEAIDRWLAAHPEQVAVEGIRLSQIAAETGAEAAAVEAQASGMMANIKAATIAADQAVMLGERFLHYAERLPFLARAQARLGLREMMADSAAVAGSLGPFLGEGTTTFRQINHTFDLFTRDLSSLRQSVGRFDFSTNRFLLKITFAAMVVVLFTGIVFFTVRAALLRMERADDLRPRDDRDASEPPEQLASRRRRG